MKILVLNAGSSSIKYQLFDMPEGAVIASGKAERIGEDHGELSQKCSTSVVERKEHLPDHSHALQCILTLLTSGDSAPVRDMHDIEAVGHRVVHGGEHFTETALISDEVLAAIDAHSALAPLHNPPNLLGIKVAQHSLPDAAQVAVFDTAFHQSMPEHAYLYGLPRRLYTEHKVRRYGFHGTSHRYVAKRACELLGKAEADLNLITCHLGNGSSIAAISGGKCIDTSMGMTPLEGLVMGTRSGDIDPGIIFHLHRALDMPVDAIERMLNKESGLLGLSGSSNDLRELQELEAQGDALAASALKIFTYRIKKTVGAYMAALGRTDAILFTAGIGENSPRVRAEAMGNLAGLGIVVDPTLNEHAVGGCNAMISPEASGVQVWVVATDEEKMIAEDTYRVARQAP